MNGLNEYMIKQINAAIPNVILLIKIYLKVLNNVRHFKINSLWTQIE